MFLCHSSRKNLVYVGQRHGEQSSTLVSVMCAKDAKITEILNAVEGKVHWTVVVTVVGLLKVKQFFVKMVALGFDLNMYFADSSLVKMPRESCSCSCFFEFHEKVASDQKGTFMFGVLCKEGKRTTGLVMSTFTLILHTIYDHISPSIVSVALCLILHPKQSLLNWLYPYNSWSLFTHSFLQHTFV